ncbi:hypothetical protein Tco_1569898 [Tanacetum coccineum]
MIQYLEKAKALTGNFKMFSIEQVPQSKNKKADTLRKIASTSFAHLTKQVLVEILKKEIDRRTRNPCRCGRRRILLDDTTHRVPCERYPTGEHKKGQSSQDQSSDYQEKSYLTTESSSEITRSKTGAKSSISSKDLHSSNTHRAHRTMIKTSNRDTSFSLTYGTEAVIPVEIGMPSLRCAEVNQAENNEELLLNLDILEERREKVAVREAKSKAKMEKYYNARVRSTAFRLGDFVYCNNEASNAKNRRKLGPKWERPYEVVEALGRGAYKLRNGSRDILPRTWNVKDLKKCYL